MSNYFSLMNDCQCRVSSVLNKNSKEFGKQFLTDGSPETCWSSDQGSPQWVAVKWPTPVQVTKIKAKFQGGFCGSRNTIVQGWIEEQIWKQLDSWPLEDTGSTQTLDLKEPHNVTRLRLLFPSSTDFYGRIIMYNFDVLGEKL